jgi:hypothetical protein
MALPVVLLADWARLSRLAAALNWRERPALGSTRRGRRELAVNRQWANGIAPHDVLDAIL